MLADGMLVSQSRRLGILLDGAPGPWLSHSSTARRPRDGVRTAPKAALLLVGIGLRAGPTARSRSEPVGYGVIAGPSIRASSTHTA